MRTCMDFLRPWYLCIFRRTDLGTPLNPLLKFRSVHVKGWYGSVAEISVFPTGISKTGLKMFPYEHFIPVTGTKCFWENSSTFATERTKWHNFLLVCISNSEVCELSLKTKLRLSRTIQRSCINLFLFFEFYLSRPCWNFSYERKTKFVPVTESVWSTGVILRGP